MRAAERFEKALRRHEASIVVALCVLAACRVLFFAAAFPVFNNVDEQAHFDLVLKYAHGDWPVSAEAHYDHDSAELIVLHGSPEFLHGEGGPPIHPPPWKFDRAQIDHALERSIGAWMRLPNHEAHAPPLYYTAAAAWLQLGRAMGISGGEIAFWLRFLNAPLMVLLVWLAHRCCIRLARSGASDRIDLRLGVPLLVATLPQDAYYSINADLMAAVLATATIWGIACLGSRDDSDSRTPVYLATGLAASAAVLTKLSNLPLLVVLAFAAGALLMRHRVGSSASNDGHWISKLLILVLASILPIAVWMLANRYLLGDALGVARKITALGWQVQGCGEIWRHPIFTPVGMGSFLEGLTETFWRGEFVWGGERIASQQMDLLYLASTALFLSIATVAQLRAASRASLRSVVALPPPLLSGLVLLGYLGFFAFLSLRYDFGTSWYPSREAPFFVSGRLMLGAVVPFFGFYVEGTSALLERVLGRVGGRSWTLVVLLCLAAVGMLVEISLSMPALASDYNWFGLP